MFNELPAAPCSQSRTWLACSCHSGSCSEAILSERPFLTPVYAHQGPSPSRGPAVAGPDVVCTRASGARGTLAEPRN